MQLKEIKEYHSSFPTGKIKVVPSKKIDIETLKIAYTPGVGKICEVIRESPEEIYSYTSKGNLIGIITNGTAVLGYGNIGVCGAKPVMEGKSVLFKVFADIDAFDIEIDEKDSDIFISIVRAISSTFGGINLEDIKAPDCFYIEKNLKEKLNIPVMHDDQWGTAVVVLAGIKNALLLAGKDIGNSKIVINGAGAAAIATGKLLKRAGAKKIYMLDSKGLITKDRKDISIYKEEFSVNWKGKVSLEHMIKESDIFIGLSKGNILTESMVLSMKKNPIIFALANPEPEILPEVAKSIREDVILATGRSDYPNQINNVLAFPYIFRGALDVRAKRINTEMLLEAANRISEIAREETPNLLCEMYGTELTFGKEYFIPKPFDRRLFTEVSLSVAKAALESGVAGICFSIDEYKKELLRRLELMKSTRI